ncbi:MAG TPA: HAMP domain-containing sensor histidine kinase [Gemmatimonadaceae bacterium]
MTFRSRLLIAFALATVVPLAMLGVGVRRQLTARLVAQHQQRVDGMARVAAQDVERESASIASRLSTLAGTLRTDDRFRMAAVRGDPGERAYLLDWAEQAMRTTGLDMLQLQDSAGRIMSSGHFRNEFDRLEPEVPRALAMAKGAVLVRARAPEGPFLALVRADSVRVADRRFDLVGGVKMDSAFLRRFAREEGLRVALSIPIPRMLAPDDTSGLSARDANAVTALPIRYFTDSLTTARLVITYDIPELALLRRDVDQWFAAALMVVVAAGLALAIWLSRRLSEPLATLTHAASTIDLEGPELTVAASRDDEIGTLARRLGSMSTRLRASAARLRQAERRATVGDMARQVNHDIKNGLIPIRNVLRHLVQVQEEQPQDLATVFGERRSTLESSVGYLDALARNYARLTPSVERRAVDVNGIATEIAASTAVASTIKLRTRLADAVPRAFGDPVIVRRIIDNLVRNAIESLDAGGGDVTIGTSRAPNGAVRIVVADTGRGMSQDELAHAFDDFFTTKPDGTGLGLSVVRRLTTDLNGSMRVESAPGQGTAFTIELPSCTPS